MNMLHIDSNTLGAHSVSRELRGAVVKEWKRAHAAAKVTYRDVAAQTLPHGTPVADAGDSAARLGANVLDEFLTADVVVSGAPMDNFGVPSALKARIDRIAVSGKTFRYGTNGPEGLAGDKRVIIASSRGGFYGAGTPGTAADFQETHLRQLFGFLGVSDPRRGREHQRGTEGAGDRRHACGDPRE